jgi:hypothetical protein
MVTPNRYIEDFYNSEYVHRLAAPIPRCGRAQVLLAHSARPIRKRNDCMSHAIAGTDSAMARPKKPICTDKLFGPPSGVSQRHDQQIFEHRSEARWSLTRAPLVFRASALFEANRVRRPRRVAYKMRIALTASRCDRAGSGPNERFGACAQRKRCRHVVALVLHH